MKSIRHLVSRLTDPSRNLSGLPRATSAAVLVAIIGISAVSVSASPLDTVTQAIKDVWSTAVGVLAGNSKPSKQIASTPSEYTVCPGGCQFGTLEDAVAAAQPGDTIRVLAGTYALTRSIVIDKPLNLIGPNMNVSPVKGTRGEEAVIALPNKGSIIVASENVVVSGFKFTSQDGSMTRGAIIGGTGISYASDRVLVSKNVFENINIAKGAAILVTDSGSNGPTGSWSVRDNSFSGISGADAGAVRVFNTKSAATVVGNRFTNIGGAAVQVANTDGSVIDGNWISETGQEGISVGVGAVGTIVRGNSIDFAQKAGDVTKGAIHLEADGGAGTMIENNVMKNSLAAMTVAGVSKDLIIRFNSFDSSNANGLYATGTDASVIIDAKNNYWGNPFGPANFGSQGSKLSSEGPQVDAEPYISNYEERFARAPRAGFWPKSNATTTASKGQAAALTVPSAPSVGGCYSGNNVCNVTKNIPYVTIQDAIDGASPNDRIDTAAITFTENVIIDIPVDLRGANVYTDPWSGSRGAETIVKPAVAGSASPSSASPSSIFRIDASVTSMVGLYINGFTFDGNNTSGSVTRGLSRGGVDIDVDAAFAASTADGVIFAGYYVGSTWHEGISYNGQIVKNVGLDPVTGMAVQLRYTATDVSTGKDNDVSVNYFENVGGGILLERNYAKVQSNRIYKAGIGVNVASHQAPAGYWYDVLDNDIYPSTVDHLAEPIGISLGTQGGSASGYYILRNYIYSSGAAATKATGIRALNVLSYPWIAASGVDGNTIVYGQYGYLLTGNDSSYVAIGDPCYAGCLAGTAQQFGSPERAERIAKKLAEAGSLQPTERNFALAKGAKAPTGYSPGVFGAMTGVRATTDNTGGGNFGIFELTINNPSLVGIESYDQGVGTASVTAESVAITGTSDKGVYAHGGTATANITYSTITGQTGYQYDNSSVNAQTATCNWWGAATGPASGKIYENSGTVTTTPFKKLSGATECVNPVVSNVNADDVVYGDDVTVTADVTDDSAISSVEYSIDDGTTWTAMSPVPFADRLVPAPQYTATITIPDVGSYTVKVRAKDNNDNQSTGTETGASSTFSVSTKALTVTGLTGDNKAYDGTTSATATGTAALSGVETGDTVTLGGTPTFTFASKNVATSISISTTGYTISGTDAGNYTLTQPTLSADITAKGLTVTGLTGSNKTYDGGTTASASGTAALLGVVSPDVVTLTGTPSYSFATKTIGTGKTISTTGYTLGGAQAGNYTLTQPSLTGNITAKTLTITGLTGNNKTYDATTSATATGTAALSGVVSGDTVTLGGSGTYTFSTKDVGTGKTISTTGFTIGGGDAGNYTLTQPTLSGNITKASLDVNADALSKVYGSIDPVKTYTFSTYQGSDTSAAGLTGEALCTRVTGESIGTYTITCYAGTLSSTNYTFTSGTTADLTITAKALTISGLTGNNKTYDGNTTATASGTASLVGVMSGDTVTLGGTPSYSFASATIGTGKTITTTGYTISGASAGNYTLTQPSLSGNITAKNLTVTGLTGDNKTYDATTAATATGTAALSGVVSGDTVTLGGTAVFAFSSKTIGTGKTISTTGYTLGGADAGNYTLTQPSLTGNITAKGLTITGLTGANKTYNGNTTASTTGTAALSGVETGDTVTLGGTPTFTFASKDVGTGISITASGYTISGTDSGNYTLTQPTGLSADITAKALTVTGLSAASKEFDGTTNVSVAGTAALSGVVSPDVVTLSGTPTWAFASATVGTAKSITRTGDYSIGGADAGNYTLTQPTLTANISAKTLTATISADPKIYDGTADATINACTLSGVVSGYSAVSCSFTGLGAEFNDANVGTGKTISIVSGLTLTGTNASNYSFDGSASGTDGIITKKQLLLNAVANSKTYGSSDPSFTYTLSGFVSGESTSNVTITGTAGDCTRATGETVGGSPYAISCLPGTLASANYSFATGATANFTINAKNLTITGLTGNNKTYNGSATATASGTASLVGVVSGDTVTVTGTPTYAFNNKNVGTGKTITTLGYTLGGADAGNYTVTQPTLSGNITAKNLTISGATANNRTYNAGTGATVSFSGASLATVETGDTVSINSSGYSASFASAGVATGISVTVTGVTLSGTDAGNYTVSQPTGLTANITQATAYVNAVAASKTWGVADPAITYSFGGLFSPDTEGSIGATGAGVCSRVYGEDVGTYVITCTAGTLSSTNYTFADGSTALLTINPMAYGTVYNTPTGTNVNPQWGSTSTPSGVSVNFATVTTSGNTTVSVLAPGDPGYVAPPSGVYTGITPLYFDITTTAVYTTPITVCFSYPAGNYYSGLPRLYHYESGAWADVTTSTDPANYFVCGSVTSLSPFMLGATLVPTAASTSLSGSVKDESGTLVRGAKVQIVDTETGAMGIAMTNQFGRYTLEGLAVGKTYVLTATGKTIRTPIVRTVTLYEALTNFDLSASGIGQLGASTESVTSTSVTTTTTTGGPTRSVSGDSSGQTRMVIITDSSEDSDSELKSKSKSKKKKQ